MAKASNLYKLLFEITLPGISTVACNLWSTVNINRSGCVNSHAFTGTTKHEKVDRLPSTVDRKPRITVAFFLRLTVNVLSC